MHKPTTLHYQAALPVLRYLKGSPNQVCCLLIPPLPLSLPTVTMIGLGVLPPGDPPLIFVFYLVTLPYHGSPSVKMWWHVAVLRLNKDPWQ